jgi:hypothetical protein
LNNGSMKAGPASRKIDSAIAVSPPDHTHQSLPARRISAYTPTKNKPTSTAKMATLRAAWPRKSPIGWLVRP